MEQVRVKLLEKLERTSSVFSFRFSYAKKIDFVPGQFLQIIFDENNAPNKELNKYLSFSSSPSKDYIEVTKRISSSGFSKRLLDLIPGQEVLIKAPFGNCIFRAEDKKILFLIGGIGITPVISIIEYVVEKKLDNDIMLIYSNRSEEDIAFKRELDMWQNRSNLKIFYTVTDCQPQTQSCIFGRIDEELIRSKIKDLNERQVFIFGPPKMVEAMKDLCCQQMLCNKDRVKIESFLGY